MRMGRLTPQTMPTSARSRANLRAAKAQLPLVRSVKMMVGSPWTAPPIAASRPSGPCPSLDTAASASSSAPAICRTAAVSPTASDECASTSPRTGLLIVLLEVLGQPLHVAPQALIEQGRRVDTRILQEMVHRDDFRDHGNVLPRVQGHNDPRHLHAEHVHR